MHNKDLERFIQFIRIHDYSIVNNWGGGWGGENRALHVYTYSK